MAAFVRRIWNNTGPDLIMQELLYGFIMALLFVTATRAGVIPFEGRLDLCLLIIGMNVTWGAIDAILFYMIDVFNQRRFINIMNSCGTRGDCVDAMMDEFGGTPLDILDPEDERKVCEMILESRIAEGFDLRRDRRDMAYSAIGCFLVTVLTIFPVIIPILVFPDIGTGTAVASLVSAALLFLVGWDMGDRLGTSRLKTGLAVLCVATVLILVGTFTGG